MMIFFNLFDFSFNLRFASVCEEALQKPCQLSLSSQWGSYNSKKKTSRSSEIAWRFFCLAFFL